MVPFRLQQQVATQNVTETKIMTNMTTGIVCLKFLQPLAIPTLNVNGLLIGSKQQFL